MDDNRFRARVRSGLGPVGALLLLALAAHAIQFPPPVAVGQWPLDTVTGTTTPDVSGNGNTATLVGAPTAVAGLAGKALNFSGANYLKANHSGSLDVVDGSFSVAAWVK